jgi:hypothetical protein
VRAAELYADLAPEFEPLTAVDRALLHQATLMLARSEHVASIKHADAAIRMSGEARRLLMTLRRHSPKRDSEPSLASILAEVAADDRREAELAADGAQANAQPVDDVAPSDKERTSDALKPGAGHPTMALDSKPKLEADLDDDIRKVCRGEVL